MRMQLALGYWPWVSFDEQLAMAAQADELGLDGVWVSEAWGQDAVRLGLGVSGPQVSEGWYGVPFSKPLARTREYVEIVRKAWAREVVSHEGAQFQLPAAEGTGLGKPLKLMIAPVQERLPIYLGAIGPKAIEQTGEIADGWLPAFFNPYDCGELLGHLDAGLEKAGRGREAIDIAPLVPVSVEEDVEAAREAVRPFVAFYLGGMGAKGKNFYVDQCEKYGFGDEAREIQDRFLSGDRMGAIRAVTPDVIETGGIACTPDELDERLAAYRDAGVDSLMAFPFGSDRAGTIERLAAFSARTS